LTRVSKINQQQQQQQHHHQLDNNETTGVETKNVEKFVVPDILIDVVAFVHGLPFGGLRQGHPGTSASGIRHNKNGSE
jgi:hypothetical protein